VQGGGLERPKKAKRSRGRKGGVKRDLKAKDPGTKRAGHGKKGRKPKKSESGPLRWGEKTLRGKGNERIDD